MFLRSSNIVELFIIVHQVEALIFFQASSFQLLKLENLTAMIILHFLIYNRSSYMNYFI